MSSLRLASGPVSSRVSELNTTSFLRHNLRDLALHRPRPRPQAAYGHERAELDFVVAAAAEDIAYVSALYASKSIKEPGPQKAKHSDTLRGA